LFRVREFRALWVSNVTSVLGDRLAVVALAILVYERTRSPVLAAVAYAAGYVPWVIGGLWFSHIADRRPRRQVMIACDLIRMVLIAVMVIPGVPIAALVVLLFVATMFAPPFEAARAAIVADIVRGELYVLGIAVVQTTFRVGILLGAAAGGVAVALLGARPALAIDAVTFGVSAASVWYGVKARPAAAGKRGADGKLRGLAQLKAGFSLVFRDRELRILVLFGWLVGLYAVPEGIAAPYAHSLGGGAVLTGLLIASTQAAAVFVTPAFSRLVPAERRLRWMGPLAFAACATLALIALRPGPAGSMVIFAVSGAFGVYQLAANTAFVARVPDERRAQAFGIANAGVIVGQGLGFVLGGAAAGRFAPADVIAVAAGAGAVAAVALTRVWRRASGADPHGANAALAPSTGTDGPLAPPASPSPFTGVDEASAPETTCAGMLTATLCLTYP
jgi:predicted MFS family arabinose efflux permease